MAGFEMEGGHESQNTEGWLLKTGKGQGILPWSLWKEFSLLTP